MLKGGERVRKITKTTLGDKLDKAWSRAILSKGKCEVCGSIEHLNPHHIEGRRNFRLRWDLRNGVCLCSGCHVFRKESAHQSPEWFHFFLEDYKMWKTVFDSHSSLRSEAGSLGGKIFRSTNDTNELFVLLEWDSLENAQKFAQSDSIKEAMKKAGVVGIPVVYFVDEVAETAK